jgi:ribosomal protein S18 acetylase RimI-like enzyme
MAASLRARLDLCERALRPLVKFDLKTTESFNKGDSMDEKQVHTRGAGPRDFKRCIAIVEGLPDSFTPTGVEELRHDLRIDNVRVAEGHSGVIGFVVCRRKTASIIEITWLAVDRDSRGNGAGSALINEALDEARRDGARLIEVKTLAASAESEEYAATRRFYEKRGFEQLETIDPYPGWDPGNPCAIYVRVL